MRICRSAVFALLLGWLWLFPAICLSEMAPSSSHRFICTGNYHGQFTEDEYQYIADNHAIVVLSKFHGAYDLEKHHQAARELKRRNPNIKVFPYYGASFWFIFTRYGQEEFKERWYWHDFKDDWRTDPEGPGSHRIERWYKGRLEGHWVNLAKSDYRGWALNIIQSWLSMTLENGQPIYDGIAFDNVLLYNVYESDGLNSPKVKDLISELAGVPDPGPEEIDEAIGRIRSRNNGLKFLMSEARQAMADKTIIFNPIADKPHLYRRNLTFLGGAYSLDAAANEDFGFKGTRLTSKAEMLWDLNILSDEKYKDKIFLLKTNVRNSDQLTEEEKLRIQRYTYGSFLLGHRPGHTYYKYGEMHLYWTEGEIAKEPKEINLNFGNPITPRYKQAGNVHFRIYDNGRVYVNMLGTPQIVTLNQNLIIMNGGVPGKIFYPGERLRIPPKDAAFLFRVAPDGRSAGMSASLHSS